LPLLRGGGETPSIVVEGLIADVLIQSVVGVVVISCFRSSSSKIAQVLLLLLLLLLLLWEDLILREVRRFRDALFRV
jgi:hypothetical protein